jgi:hypothetical protein
MHLIDNGEWRESLLSTARSPIEGEKPINKG